MIALEINEDDYWIAGSGTSFSTPGEFGPLDCGCRLIVVAFDQAGPRLEIVMQRKDAEFHPHVRADFDAVRA